ncbi:hypothetical protein [Rubrivivax gelatinosus]|nr:hypothetical protein [Rubrivivax gelatinosus]
MPEEELNQWRWWIQSETPPGRMVRSRWLMTEAEAAKYPGAVKIEGTLEIRRPSGRSVSSADFMAPPTDEK